MRTSLRYRLLKQQRFGVFLFIAIISIAEVLLHSDYFFPEETSYISADQSLITVLQEKERSAHSQYASRSKKDLKPFNPNHFQKEQWMELGFSEKQALAILKYKRIVGNNFTSKQQLQKCYVILDEKFAEIQSYVLLPETSSKSYFPYKKYDNFHSKSTAKINLKPFNPNDYTEKEWQQIGFSEKQAQTIIRYKHKLGGTFNSKDELQKCYVISDEKFAELSAYIQLPNQDSKVKSEPKSAAYKPFNPNKLSEEGWKNIGFSDKQVSTIMKFKKLCGGTFSSTEQLAKCYAISAEKMAELKPYIDWNL